MSRYKLTALGLAAAAAFVTGGVLLWPETGQGCAGHFGHVVTASNDPLDV